MLHIRQLSYSVGDRPLLNSVNWQIRPGKRAALIGPNGAGKTTLLRLIAGELEPDQGVISIPKNYRIGYLPQEEVSFTMERILDGVKAGNKEAQELEKQIEVLHRQLDAGEADQQKLLDKLGDLETQYQLIDGYAQEARAKAILAGLGFTPDQFEQPLRRFSGGWRMRIYLARLLIWAPDLLLLDEPTNHLDLESLEWLEQYLRNFPGSMIIVSHDRFFIDRLADEIYELERAALTHYPGNYHFYEARKAERLEQLYRQWEEQQAERQRLQCFIDRFRYKASKAPQVQSRIKQLEKMQTIELPPPPPKLHFRIQVEQASYKDVLRIENMSFRYDREWVLRNLNLQLYRGDRVALVGVNGAGKTTLTRLIFGELTPQEGLLKLGERVKIAYYAQHQIDRLTLSARVIDEVAETAMEAHRARLRDVLGMFQFSGDAVSKRIEVLSGGEKARVSLAKILLSPANFLLMDEPTNHLDLTSKEALENALREYDGTLMLISHDRYFLDKLVHRVIELREGRLRVYEGNYSEYLARRAAEDKDATMPQKPSTNNSASGPKSKEQKRQEAQARQAISRERRRLEERISEYEQAIETLEKEKTILESRMADPATYREGDKAAALQKEYLRIREELRQAYQAWEDDHGRYETLLEKLKQSLSEDV